MSRFTVITFGTAQFSWAIGVQKRLSLDLGAWRHVAYDADSAPVQKARAENETLAAIPRGYGLWIWKPYILVDALAQSESGDYVIYLDAGVAPIADMAPWFEQIRRRPINLFAPVPPRPAWAWTKRACFTHMQATSPEFRTWPLLSAGIQAYRNVPESHAFIDELRTWMRVPELMCEPDYSQGASEERGFMAHRHDQSVLTLLAASQGIHIAREPTQYGIWLRNSREAQLECASKHPGLVDESCPQILDVHRGRNRSNPVAQHLWRIRRKIVGARRGLLCV